MEGNGGKGGGGVPDREPCGGYRGMEGCQIGSRGGLGGMEKWDCQIVSRLEEGSAK